MITKQPTLTVLLCLFLTIGIGCNDECPPQCPDGRVRVGDACECPSGTREYGSMCIEKNPGSYLIESSSCDCIDGGVNFAYDPRELSNPRNVNPDGSYSIEMALNYQNGGTGTTSDYYPETDSIYFWWFAKADFFNCGLNSYATGKFMDSRNKIKIDIFFFEGDVVNGDRANPVDSCTLVMHNGF